MVSSRKNRDRMARFLFVLYCAVMLWLLFFRSSGWVDGLSYQEQLRNNYNLIPFYTISNYWQVVTRYTNYSVLFHCFINLTGNVFLFVPAGYLMPRIFKKMRKFFRFFTTGLSVMFLVEVVQLFTLLGSFDVDDLILNLFGMTIGFIIYHQLWKK